MNQSATAPTLHSATDPAEFNVVCCSKSNLPNGTDSNPALLPYLHVTHRFGSVHEWSGVCNGPKATSHTKPDKFENSTFATKMDKMFSVHINLFKLFRCPH